MFESNDTLYINSKKYKKTIVANKDKVQVRIEKTGDSNAKTSLPRNS